MSSNLSIESHRPSPPESPPFSKQHITMDSHLPNTPQSPPPASACALDISNTMSSTDLNVAVSTGNMQSSIGNGFEANPTEMSNKRKRETDDDGDQEQKKVHIESGTPGIEALHRDVGPPYRLASTPYSKAAVDLTVDLFKLYSLEGIANSVARGGENPRKMGKTYKKQMRTSGLSGKFDAVKKQDNELGLFDMLQVPDEEWDRQMQGIKPKDRFDEAVKSNMAQAMTMSKGRIPKDRWDPTALALSDPPAPVVAATKPGVNNQRIPAQGPPLASAQSRMPKVPAEKARPQRNKGKRGYKDEDFKGYGDGYADDTADDPSFRPGDEETTQRRKKGSSGYHFPPAMRQAYGPGTVGA